MIPGFGEEFKTSKRKCREFKGKIDKFENFRAIELSPDMLPTFHGLKTLTKHSRLYSTLPREGSACSYPTYTIV